MDCSDIRDALLSGSIPAGADVDAHVRDCAACAALLEHQNSLGRAFPTGSASSSDNDERWRSLEKALEGERGPRAWLRSRSTPFRLVAAALTLVSLVLLGGRSPEAGPLYAANAWVMAFGFSSVAALGFIVTRFDHPERARSARLALAAITLLLPVARAFSSPPDAALPHAHAAAGLAETSIACFSYGLLLAAPFLFVIWLLDRSDRSVLETLAAVGTTAGLVANAALARHCPIANPAHLLLGHAAIGAALAGLGAISARWARRAL